MSDISLQAYSHPIPSLGHTLAIATLVQIICTASVLALTALAPTVAGDLGIDAYWIGYQVSAIYAAGMVSSAVAGTLVARYGASRIEQAALAFTALGFLGLALGNIAAAAAATVSIGIGYGLNNPASSQLLSRVTPLHKRNLVFSLKQSGVPLGGVVASVAFPFIARMLGWHSAFIAGAVIAFAVWGWVSFTHKDPPETMSKAGSFGKDLIQAQSTIWKSPKLRTLSLLGLLYSAMQLSMSAFAVVSLVHDAGWTLIAAGSVAACMQLAGAVGRVGWGVIADRIGGGFVTLALIGMIAGICCILFFWMPEMPPAAQIALFVVMGATSIGWNGVLLAEIAKSAPHGRVGAFTGAVLVYTFIGVIVGPSGFAILYAVTGDYGISFLALSLAGFIGTFLGLNIHRQTRRLSAIR